MTHPFFDRLEERARSLDSLLCIGLDPHPADLSDNTPNAARNFCLNLIEATHDLAVAFKPNAAFFEAFGPEGWQALSEVISAVPDGIPVILDAKRGDIDSTAEAYARSAFESLHADALTVNPYLGVDALRPFIKNPAQGVFILCKTSNPGSVDIQDLSLWSEGKSLLVYEKVALLAEEWNKNKNIGLVIGATQPDALSRIRKLVPNLWFLSPGVGIQGGDLHKALKAGLRKDGLGMLVSVSRAISCSSDPHQAALDLTIAIRQARQQKIEQGTGKNECPFPASLADAILNAGCIRFGNFTLKSGIQSPIYLDLRCLVSKPGLLAEVADAYIQLLRQLEFDHIAALPYAALPIGTAISLKSGWPMIYPRKVTKTYGTQVDIEGIYQQGDHVVVVDDLATTGGSKFDAIDKLISAGLSVTDVAVLIDRQSGATEALTAAGYKLHAVFTLSELLDYYEGNQSISNEQTNAVRNFLKKS